MNLPVIDSLILCLLFLFNILFFLINCIILAMTYVGFENRNKIVTAHNSLPEYFQIIYKGPIINENKPTVGKLNINCGDKEMMIGAEYEVDPNNYNKG